MAQTIPTKEPAFVVAGDSITWKRSLADYPASAGWVLSYRLINAAGKIDITSAASGDDHLVSVTAVTSAAWVAGDYTWTAYVTKTAERYTLGSGAITVRPNLAAQAAGFDTRSHAAKTLDAIEAVIEGRATQSHLSYSVAGRQMQFIPIPDLLVLRDKYRVEVRSEENAVRVANGLASRNRILVRL